MFTHQTVCGRVVGLGHNKPSSQSQRTAANFDEKTKRSSSTYGKLMDSDRTWPLPKRSHVMRMGWHDLLFAHWSFEPEEISCLLPDNVTLDTYNGKAWVAIVPFRMTDVAPRGIPAVPGMSAFPELNIRTYVTLQGKPGVWFFSLDATNPIAVRLARTAFFLPYMDARISIEKRRAGITMTAFGRIATNRRPRSKHAIDLSATSSTPRPGHSNTG